MAEKTTWTVEQGIMVVAVIVIVGGAALALYPSLVAMADAWSKARAVAGRGQPSDCATPANAANTIAVFCATDAKPGGPPTRSSVDTPLGAVRRMDDALQR